MPTGIYKRTEAHKKSTGKAQQLLWSNPEYKKRMSKAHVGKKHSLETKKKISKRNKGNPSWSKGLHLSKEHRRRISKANKGQIPWSKGLYLSEKHKMNIKKALNSPEIKKKLSESRKGKGNHFYKKKHTVESKMKMSQSHEGKKNPNWLGGISFEPYGIEFNEKLKEQIREQDNYICQIKECATLQNGRKHPIHHRDYDKRNNKPKNLITLCHPCHLKTNYNRDYWQDYFQRREAML